MSQANDAHAPLSWAEFDRVQLCVGTVVSAQISPKARKPAYILEVDFGDVLGVKKSSAQITDLYLPQDLVGKQVIAVVNFAPKQVGNVMSQCLVTGFYQSPSGAVVLAVPDRAVKNGTRLA